jgi:hypothetical protein
MEKAIYIPPTDENGKFYWVPVVAKNKDYLLGFLNGMEMTMITLQIFDDLNPALGSERFNDILPNGKRVGKMSKSEFKDHVKSAILDEQERVKARKNHPDHDPGILNYFFHVSCSCGNFYGFNTPNDVPDDNLRCDWCDKLLFHYLNKDDSFFKYNGPDIDVNETVELVKKELGIYEDDDDEEEEDYE